MPRGRPRPVCAETQAPTEARARMLETGGGEGRWGEGGTIPRPASQPTGYNWLWEGRGWISTRRARTWGDW